LGVIPGDGTEGRIWNTYEQRESRRGDERLRKWMDVPYNYCKGNLTVLRR
jgi:hypothetical protein